MCANRRFRGGLDIQSSSGEKSVYEVHDDSELMFHVSTLLPHSDTDGQQLEKKRHIGNDKVALVFQDRDTPFCPSMIRSKLLHVFVLVQPVRIGAATKRYKVSESTPSPLFRTTSLDESSELRNMT
jgi:RAP1 GTPase activating protein 1